MFPGVHAAKFLGTICSRYATAQHRPSPSHRRCSFHHSYTHTRQKSQTLQDAGIWRSQSAESGTELTLTSVNKSNKVSLMWANTQESKRVYPDPDCAVRAFLFLTVCHASGCAIDGMLIALEKGMWRRSSIPRFELHVDIAIPSANCIHHLTEVLGIPDISSERSRHAYDLVSGLQAAQNTLHALDAPACGTQSARLKHS